MNDETKGAIEWLRTLDEDDRDYYDAQRILAHIDGEPARLAAAREEAIKAWQAGECPDCGCRLPALGPHTCLATPLNATPLADELRTLRAERNALQMRASELLACTTAAEDYAKTVTVARDALRARVAELEAQVEAQRASSQRHMNGRESYWLEQRVKWIAEHDRYAESCKWHADRANKAEAQVAAAREACRALKSDRYGADSVRWSAAADVLRAMDEALKAHNH